MRATAREKVPESFNDNKKNKEIMPRSINVDVL